MKFSDKVFWLTLWVGTFGTFGMQSLAARTVELQVYTPDSAVVCHSLQVLDATRGDTVASFDSLYFGSIQRSMLYFDANIGQELRLAVLTCSGDSLRSPSFEVTSGRTTFLATLSAGNIDIAVRDYRYPLKSSSLRSYLVFLLIFIVVKWLIAGIYAHAFKLHHYIFFMLTAIFIVSSALAWLLPVYYGWRILAIIIVEAVLLWTTAKYLLKKPLPLRHAIFMPMGINLAGFGLVMICYLGFVFW